MADEKKEIKKENKTTEAEQETIFKDIEKKDSEAKIKSNIKYPPYVNSYGQIVNLFAKIKEAAVPPKVTTEFIYTVLGLKSTSYRAMIPLMKKLAFVDSDNKPTDAYKEYREDDKSEFVMGQRVRETYSDLFSANEYAYKLNKEELTSKLKTLLGVASDDNVLPNVVGTFMELVKLSKFDADDTKKKKKDADEKIDKDKEKVKDQNTEEQKQKNDNKGIYKNFGISYMINLNLPVTTEIEVYNVIFKSLKENLLTNE